MRLFGVTFLWAADARSTADNQVFRALEWVRVTVFTAGAAFTFATESAVVWRILLIVALDLSVTLAAANRLRRGAIGPNFPAALLDVFVATVPAALNGYPLPLVFGIGAFAVGLHAFIYGMRALPSLFTLMVVSGAIGRLLHGEVGATPPSADRIGLVLGVAFLAAGTALGVTQLGRTRDLENELTQAEQRLTSALDVAASGLALVDRSRRVVSVNPAFAGMLGRTADELRGQPFTALGIGPAGCDAVDDIFDGARSTFTVDHESGDPDDARAISMHLAPVVGQGGVVVEVVVSAHDVSEERRTQEVLESLIRSKDEFVASVSHEIRTPLTSVVGFASELLGRWDEFDDMMRKELLALIESGSRDVSAIIDDLLVAARADAGTLTMLQERVDLDEVVVGVLEMLPDREIGFESHGGVGAIADRRRVRQIIRNLVSNAMRYGGDEISVRMTSGGGWIDTRVVDDGQGAEDPDHIFEPYVRTSGESSQPSAVGLGLTVSRDLAQLMGGHLWYERVGDTTHFVLRLPAAEPASEPAVFSALRTAG